LIWTLKGAFWRMIGSPVQGGWQTAANVLLPSATFLCHLHRKMPDLDWDPPLDNQTAKNPKEMKAGP